MIRVAIAALLLACTVARAEVTVEGMIERFPVQMRICNNNIDCVIDNMRIYFGRNFEVYGDVLYYIRHSNDDQRNIVFMAAVGSVR